MTAYRSLTLQAGTYSQIQDANSIIVGNGIETAAGDLTITPTGTNVSLAAAKILLALAGAGAFDFSAATGTFKTSTGAVSLLGDTTIATAKSLLAAGTAIVDFSGGSGIFKTTTGAVTIGPGAVTVSGATTFTAAGTAFTVNNDGTVTGVLTVTGRVDAAATLSLGTVAATAVNIGRTGQLTTIKGNFQVDGTETIVGASTFNANATFEGNVIFGNAATDTVQFVARVLDDIHFVKENGHTIDVDTSTTGATPGGALTVKSGTGSAASGATEGEQGGEMRVTGGAGGAASTTAGGNASFGGTTSLTGGAGGAGAASTNGGSSGGSSSMVGGSGGAGGAATTAGIGGGINIQGGDAGANGGGGGAAGGNVSITAGNASGTAVDGTITIGNLNTSAIAVGAAGVTTTVTGALSQLTGAVTLTANAASSFTTSVGALTITSAAAATWKTSAGLLTLEGAAGVQVNGSAATSYLTFGVVANRIVIQSGIELETTGTGMIDLPSLFKINNIAVGATVTAANLDTLTNASNADALHFHTTGSATTIAVSGTAGETIAAGAPVVFDDAAGTAKVFRSDANGAGELVNTVGFNTTAAVLNDTVSVKVNGEVTIPDAIWDTVPVAADVGKKVFLSENVGKVTLTAPATIGSTVIKCGIVTQFGAGTSKICIQIGDGVVL